MAIAALLLSLIPTILLSLQEVPFLRQWTK